MNNLDAFFLFSGFNGPVTSSSKVYIWTISITKQEGNLDLPKLPFKVLSRKLTSLLENDGLSISIQLWGIFGVHVDVWLVCLHVPCLQGLCCS